ncbi:NAD(P)-binding domain-containing protein [Bacillus sp. V3-13]|uniref:NAD(P)-binding domain-containing protein n=1 Tax=Bacillus sp. V3-13 TaxID=2053728 RepID=UPI00267DD200
MLQTGDIIIDGGNSNYKESIRRAEELKKQGVYFLDVGTSGEMEGARNGACAMISGDIGTTSTKSVLFSLDRSIIESCGIEYPLYSPAAETAEQDPDEIFAAVIKTIQQVIEASNVQHSEQNSSNRRICKIQALAANDG